MPETRPKSDTHSVENINSFKKIYSVPETIPKPDNHNVLVNKDTHYPIEYQKQNPNLILTVYKHQLYQKNFILKNLIQSQKHNYSKNK